MRIKVFKCDGCGKVKGEANAWLLGLLFFQADNCCMYAIGDWEEKVSWEANIEHFCSESCAMKRQGEFIRKPKQAAGDTA